MEKYYRILDLHTTASEQEVKQAYRVLVKVWHPDRFTHDIKLQKRAEDKLKEINDAYQRIVDHLNNSHVRQQSQQYQRTEKRENTDSQPPPKQPYNSWICPECLRTNYMDSLSCGCGFKTNAAERETYKADQTPAALYESILFNKSMKYMERAAFLSRYLLVRFPNSKEAVFIKQGTQSTTSPKQAKPCNHIGYCDRCGQNRVIFHGEFRENISYFFQRKERTIDAELCFPCTGKIFLQFTGKTLVLTWWGIIGAIVGPIYILSNSGWFLFNTFRFVSQKIQRNIPLNAASVGRTKPIKLRHLKKNWGWYLLGIAIVIALINSTLNPVPAKKQSTTLTNPPSAQKGDIFDQVAKEPLQKSEPTFTEPIQPLPTNGNIKRYVNGIPLAPVKALADWTDEELNEQLLNYGKGVPRLQNEKDGVKKNEKANNRPPISSFFDNPLPPKTGVENKKPVTNWSQFSPEPPKDEAIAPLKITTRDSGNHYFVKVVDWYTRMKVCTVFIRSGQSVSLDVPLGSYKLMYATGEKWYGTKFLFGPQTAYSVADKKFDFEMRNGHVSGYTVELILQPNGNLKTNKIAAEDFE